MSKHKIETVVDLRGHSEPPRGGSDRAFGLVFGAFFAILGLYPLIRGGSVRVWAVAVAMLLVLAAIVRPQLLAPVNKLWHRFGLALNRIVSPAALFVAYGLAIVPTGLLMRALGKDPLHLRLDPDAKTYWLERTPPARPDKQMTRQF